jgi:hypothetical protein
VNGRILAIVVVLALAVGAGVGIYVAVNDDASVGTEPAVAVRAPSERPSAPAETTPPSASPEKPSATRAPRRAPGAAAPEAPAPAAAAPELGTLRIEADVPNAQVFIDRQFVGTAPVTAEGVKPGPHQLNVSAEGFEGIAQTIDVEAGPRDVTIRFREVRLNASLAVVHKHRIGSCMGQLVATAQGLRYDTSDKEDRFTTSLSDLETFTVDYQDRNLKVKLRRGKQYNFTDPDGNADRLFVFQRDVDKARQRLAKGETASSD